VNRKIHRMQPIINIRGMEKPFVIKLGFHKLFEQMESVISTGKNPLIAQLTEQVMANLKHRTELSEGIDIEKVAKYKEEIDLLMCLLFPNPLTHNEIKVATPPLLSNLLYSSERFKLIFGDIHDMEPKEFEGYSPDRIYIHLCTFILAKYYGISQNISSPPVYHITNETGVDRHYKSVFNADFIEMKPLGETVDITPELLTKLKDNYDDITVWKEVFPPNSWELKGFGLRSFINVSGEEALSLLKNLLIDQSVLEDTSKFEDEMNRHIRTIFDIPDLWSTFTMYDAERGLFKRSQEGKTSIGLNTLKECDRADLMCSHSAGIIFDSKQSFVLSNTDKITAESRQYLIYDNILKQGIKSYIMTPLYDGERLLGVIEFASNTPDSLNMASLDHIKELVTICRNAIKSYMSDYTTQLTAIIQNEYTAIHPSVAWKFREQAELIAESQLRNEKHVSDQIRFTDLTALYGQTDIAHSSQVRNQAISSDLQHQMAQILHILMLLNQKVDMPLVESIIYQTNIIKEKLSSDLAAGMEQQVTDFLRVHINPLFKQMQHRDAELNREINEYFDELPNGMDILYKKRKDFDDSVELINRRMAKFLDKAQKTAQQIYPHYFERYKTDGVEHNMFIGGTISPQLPFEKLYLDNLRLWQLKTMCEMEIEHHIQKPNLPLSMDVASLIMVYSNHLAIRYRMDEKQFDVDGAYNARYEIIKKRIDKAHIKGTSERITQPGKIVIVYTQPSDLDEYLNYVSFLTYQGFVVGEPEVFDIENLQGVAGLKGLRVQVNYNYKEDDTSVNVKSSKALAQLN